jgi:hypothetical protein
MKKHVMSLGTLVLMLAFGLVFMGCKPATHSPAIYTITINPDIQNGSITANHGSSTAGTEVTLAVSSDGGYQLKSGSLIVSYADKTIDITETHDVFTFKMPAANVTVSAAFVSTNASLYSLTVNTGPLSPNFSADGLTYTVAVPNNITSITVTAVKADANAVISYAPSQTVDLPAGTPVVVTVTVKAEDETERAYTLTVTRAQNNDTNLNSLTVSDGTLSPAFSADWNNYTVTVPNDITSITVMAVPAAATAALSYVPSPILTDLPTGTPVTVMVTVKAEDETEKVYGITVTRAKNNNTSLSSLMVNPGALVPAFSADWANYAVTVPNDITSVTVTGVKADPAAVITYSPSQTVNNLPAGTPVTVMVTVKAENNTENIYGITVTRAKNNNTNLNSLAIIPGTLSPNFSANWANYAVTVPNNITSATVMANPADANAVISYAPSQIVNNLPTGTPVVVTVTVKAQNETEKTYTVAITRAKNDNANLNNLTVSAGALSPVFSADGLNYAVTVPNNTTSITVTGVKADPTAVITYSPSQTVNNLPAGTPVTVMVTVKAENETEKVYTITVTRLKNDNANLNGLIVSAGTLSPNFSTEWGNYTVTVPNNITSITVTAPSADPSAVVSYAPSQTVNNLPAGTPVTVMVTVKAESEAEKVYTVAITRVKNDNANMDSLTVSAGALSPDFSADGLNYAVTVPNNITSITVNAAPADAAALISYAPSKTITSLSPGIPVPVTITVKAENEAEKIYTITVTRLKNSNASLNSLTVNAGSLSPDFSTDVFNYAVTVPNNKTSITVNAAPAASTAAISYAPSQTVNNLPAGTPVPVTVTVKAEDETEKAYTITVTRLKSSNANLDSFTVNTGTLSPNFSADTLAYTVAVPNNITSITVTAVKADATAAINYAPSQTVNNLPAGTPVPITVTVKAENETERAYTLTVTRAQNNAKAITSFKIGSNEGIINEADKTITVIVPYGTSVAALTPTVSISADTSILPLSGTAQNFAVPKPYTVTAEDGTPQVYTVTVIVKGQASITITGPQDENVLVTGFTGAKPVLSRSGKDSKSKDLTISVDDTNYTLVEWYINGVKKSTNPANSITIRSADYPLREHSITVVVYRGTVPYSKLFTFEVQE